MRTLLTLLCLLLPAYASYAADGQTITYRGRVRVEFRGDAVSRIVISGADHTYPIVIDQHAAQIVPYHGKQVEVTGTIVRIDGKPFLRVSNIRLLE